jgi:hypothetical protein
VPAPSLTTVTAGGFTARLEPLSLGRRHEGKVMSYFVVEAEDVFTGIYGWMPNSTIAWDYSYQYLSGGVNTNSGWET